jgi:ABC-type glutathione transport system ATPase component
MSFVGAGSFGNYDRTAQTTGLPTLARQTTHENNDFDTVAGGSSPSRHDDVSRTRATSVTEVAESDTPRNEKAKTADTLSDEDEEDERVEQARRNSMVQALARKYTSQSNATGIAPGENVFMLASTDENSPLNPNGPNFDARTWAKAVVAMVQEKGHNFRTTGVAYQHLNVFGFGSPTDYQKDFLNIWLEVAGLARRVLGHGKRRIDILRDFDGIVRKGEMCVVLGPPGSGCSTLLKTIAGEYSGIFVDDNSYFNYQGEMRDIACISRDFADQATQA